MHLLSTSNLARLTALFYLTVIVAGGWSELFVRSDLLVPESISATAANISESSGLLRTAFAADMVMVAAFLMVGLGLWALLRGVSREAATAMLVFNAISVAVMSANLLNHAALVALANYETQLDEGTFQALSAFFLEMHGIGYLVAQVFFGLYLLPLGVLVYCSGMLPKALGVLLIVGFAADMGQIAVEFFTPDVSSLADVVSAPAGIAELALTVWLLVKGIRFPAADLQRGHLGDASRHPDPAFAG